MHPVCQIQAPAAGAWRPAARSLLPTFLVPAPASPLVSEKWSAVDTGVPAPALRA